MLREESGNERAAFQWPPNTESAVGLEDATLLRAFLTTQDKIYARFADMEEGLRAGTVPAPYFRSPKAGYFIHLNYPETIAEQVAALSAVLSEIIPGECYLSHEVHSTLFNFGVEPSESFSEDQKIVEAMLRAIDSLGLEGTSNLGSMSFRGWYANRDTVILAGVPQSAQYVRTLMALQAALADEGIHAQVPHMAHTSVFRFAVSVNGDQVTRLIERLRAEPLPAAVYPERITAGSWALGTSTRVGAVRASVALTGS